MYSTHNIPDTVDIFYEYDGPKCISYVDGEYFNLHDEGETLTQLLVMLSIRSKQRPVEIVINLWELDDSADNFKWEDEPNFHEFPAKLKELSPDIMDMYTNITSRYV